ncbi:hypothetical protein QJS04_geneDACA014978 [Acorus gramineus]|uniref:Integrase zinc-binding domain-containing protein n=1 Tax=Acorus gramineus TaxID=55184 RepID=A0AAV9AMV6_ACOGR|nr:hypothetical protein QJS04_geneDACA014978 [Acorus gramineus]
MLAKKVLRMGYYWPTLKGNCNKYVRHCVQCQTHANENTYTSIFLASHDFTMAIFYVGSVGDG